MGKKFVFTFNYAINYGAFLQMYSLSQLDCTVIADMKPCAKIEMFRQVKESTKKKYPVIWRFLSIFRYVQKYAKKKEIKGFEETNRIRLSPPIMGKTKKWLQKFFDNSVAICGSDQIWNPAFVHDKESFFFADVAKFKKKISYAASLGMKSWPPDFESKVVPMLRKFDAISVREYSAVEYLASLGVKNVVCVCDPTMLCDADFYRREFKYNRILSGKPFVYKIRESIPKNLQDFLPQEKIVVDLQKSETLCSVTNWLANIDNSEYVVTDSFHCTVFCILFHKPFLVIPNHSNGKGMNERFVTLLGKTHLEYCCLACDESIHEISKKINISIDWDSIDAIIGEWREYSLNWLEHALGEYK